MDGLVDQAKLAGYQTRLSRANALEFGAPQKRDRVFVLGAKARPPVAPTPTHSSDGGERPGRLPAVRAGEALRPFAGPEFHEPDEIVEGRWAEHLKSVPPGWNYKAHTAWGGHPDPTFVTETRFWNFLLKLSPDKPSWTIPANPGPWTGPFHWTSRRLRIPELAALQGFPPDYRLRGQPARTRATNRERRSPCTSRADGQLRFEPRETRPSARLETSVRCLSLFSGCGGLDLGMQRAGFEITAGVDNSALCRESHRLNFGGIPFYLGAIKPIHGRVGCRPTARE